MSDVRHHARRARRTLGTDRVLRPPPAARSGHGDRADRRRDPGHRPSRRARRVAQLPLRKPFFYSHERLKSRVAPALCGVPEPTDGRLRGACEHPAVVSASLRSAFGPKCCAFRAAENRTGALRARVHRCLLGGWLLHREVGEQGGQAALPARGSTSIDLSARRGFAPPTLTSIEVAYPDYRRWARARSAPARFPRGKCEALSAKRGRHKTAKYLSISHWESWTRYSSHSFRFSST